MRKKLIEEQTVHLCFNIALCCHPVSFTGITNEMRMSLPHCQMPTRKQRNVSSTVISFHFTNRHASKLELHSHTVLGPEPLWHLLHPGSTWTLLHWRVHSVLHHHQTLPVLPHSGQHPGLPAEPTSSHLVSHVLLLWVQRQRASPQRVLLALLETHYDEEADWIMSSVSVAVRHFLACVVSLSALSSCQLRWCVVSSSTKTTDVILLVFYGIHRAIPPVTVGGLNNIPRTLHSSFEKVNTVEMSLLLVAHFSS